MTDVEIVDQLHLKWTLVFTWNGLGKRGRNDESYAEDAENRPPSPLRAIE